MPLVTGNNFSIPMPTPTEALSRINQERIASRRQAEAKKTMPGNSYISNRGILCEKGFETEPDRIVLFQFNPETITDVKSNNYEASSKNGFTHVDHVWASGGERIITFKLNFEATAGVNTPMFNKVRKASASYGNDTYNTLQDNFPRGTLDDTEILQSFLYPKRQDPRLSVRFSSGGHIPAPKFMPPPIVIFSFGNYYLEGYVTDVNLNHTLFNERLFPVRTEADVTYKVLEKTQLQNTTILASKLPSGGTQQMANSTDTPKKIV